ncbi:MAG: hypothetical protein IPP01_06220 [Saprospiraceae bacterium]|nr:hypothetical protein [Saprospiraceae bacterium]
MRIASMHISLPLIDESWDWSVEPVSIVWLAESNVFPGVGIGVSEKRYGGGQGLKSKQILAARHAK